MPLTNQTTGNGDWSLDSFSLISKLKHDPEPSFSEDFTSHGKITAHGETEEPLADPESDAELLVSPTNGSAVENVTTMEMEVEPMGGADTLKQAEEVKKVKKVNSLGSSAP